MISTIIISLFLLSTIFGFSQKNNLKLSAVVFPGYQGFSLGYEKKTLKKSNIFLEYGLAPGFGYIKGDTNDYYHFEIRILVALCLGL
ncbi:MAG: hypothetical protein K8R58_02415 [Bacteroidales bacterium]|nr:hypothetical protein [Bacteroidales bacterium]